MGCCSICIIQRLTLHLPAPLCISLRLATKTVESGSFGHNLTTSVVTIVTCVLLGLFAWLPGTHPLACRLPSRLSFPSHRGERLVGSMKGPGGNYPDVSSFTEANVGSMGIFAPLNFCLTAHECRFNEIQCSSPSDSNI